MPVLSKTTTSASASRSSAVADLISSPRWNSRPEAAVVTAGTASASAQGQVMISVAAAMFTASRTSWVVTYHQAKAIAASTWTPGEYSRAARSASGL